MNMELKPGATDPGLYVLVNLVRLLGISADPEQIRHRFGGLLIGIAEMLRCAKDFGLKAGTRLVDWDRLTTMPMPAIASRRREQLTLIRAHRPEVHLQKPGYRHIKDYVSYTGCGRVAAPFPNLGRLNFSLEATDVSTFANGSTWPSR